LVGVDHDVVDRYAVAVISLHVSCPGVPDFDSAVFRASDHPFAFTVEGYSSDVACVAFECEYRSWIR